ncbi:50S ribosomal protein L11 methyltransferase [Salicibibacter cibarius]|uniref:Ribosomal protein L11 methyltransferase n=1 Tax=Salicibibacter cibarius TaxID=2743000 RepID=A0A7T7CBH1_9BACI|nr:50S ribosomal protein L11 methyltransferase [Salicibibacter cibarius]QQK75814.1 50S ribosomal protein L11 methyltransferase [Salicibibacter cibarius]
MNWIEYRIHTTHEAADAVANMFTELGSNGTLVEDAKDRHERPKRLDETGQPSVDHLPIKGVVLKAYFPESEQKDDDIRKALASIQQRSGMDMEDLTVDSEIVKEEDWEEAWKAYYKPIRVSPNLIVTPSWENAERGTDDVVVELDPGMAFGTGAHATTILCLQALERIVNEGDSVIDVGAGSGVLSIAAAKFGAASVFAYDLDELAVNVAKENVVINQVEDKVTVKKSDLFSETGAKGEVIVANLLADIIIRMAPDVKAHLVPGGHLLVSGIIANKKDDVRQALEIEGFRVAETLEQEDWVAILLQS